MHKRKVFFLKTILYTILALFAIFYLAVVGCYRYIKSIDANKTEKYINYLSDKCLKNKGYSFQIKNIDKKKAFISITLSDVKYKDFISIKSVNFSVDVKKILYFQNPIAITSLNNTDIIIQNYESAQNESDEDTDVAVQSILERIRKSPKTIWTTLKSGVKCDGINIYKKNNNTIQSMIYIDKCGISPMKRKSLNYQSIVNISGKILNSSPFDVKATFTSSYLKKFTKFDISGGVKNPHKILKKAVNLPNVFNSIDSVNISSIIAFDRKKVKIQSELDVNNIDLANKNNNLKISRTSAKISGNIRSFKLEDFKITYNNKAIVHSAKDTNLTLEKLSSVKGSVILNIDQDLLDLKNYFGIDILKNSSIEAKDLWAKFTFNNNELMPKIEINSSKLKIHIPQYLPSTEAKNVVVKIEQDAILADVDKISISSTEIDKTSLNIDLKNSNFSAKIKIADVGLTTLFQALVDENPKLYNAIQIANATITGNSDNRVEFAEMSLKNIIVKSTFNEMFKNMEIAGEGGAKYLKSQFFPNNNTKADIRVNKLQGSDAISIATYIKSPLPLDFMENSPMLTKAITNIEIKDNILNVNVDGYSNSHKIVDVFVKVNTDGVNTNVDLRGINGKTFFSLHNKITNNDNSTKITGCNLMINKIIERNLAFPYPKSENNVRKNNISLSLDIKNSTLYNDVNVEYLNTNLCIEKYQLRDFAINYRMAKADDYEEIKTTKQNNIINISGNKINNLISGLFNKINDSSIKNPNITLELNDNFAIFSAKTRKIKIKLNKEDVENINFITPGFSSNSSYFMYSDLSLNGKYFSSPDTNIINIDSLLFQSAISKIFVIGYIDLTNDFIDIDGKFDSARQLNSILTAEKIPFLNKILTLNSKHGGYGVVSYKIKGNFSELSSKSVKISGDRGNMVLFGGLALVNPLFAIPMLFTDVRK